MAITIDQFLDRLEASGLLMRIDAQALLDPAGAVPPPADGEQLARLLVQQKKLTAYQVQQICAGQGKSLLLGNYVVLDKLGEGGMGIVLKAEHRRMERIVALKVLSPDVTKSPDAVKRFQREVKAAARLDHPNIVTAHDADDAGGTPFLVMQYVEGQDLSSIVRTNGPLPVEETIDYILQAARGLEYAHHLGVVHRDIKPSNLLLATEGTVKVLDMGLARIEGETGAQAELTSTGTVMGTVDYMAPEQALSTKRADARSDVYSLGMTLWYLLAGRPAYDGDSLMARLLAHREAPVPALRDVRPEAPEELADLFRRMVAKHPEDRVQSMTEVIAALERCLRSPALTASGASSPTDEDRFSVFPARFRTQAQARTATAARAAATKPLPMTAQQCAATVTVSQPELATDPQTLTQLVAGAAPKMRTAGRSGRQRGGRPWWRHRRVQIGVGIAMAFAAAGIFFASRGEQGEPLTTPDGQLATDSADNRHDPASVAAAPAAGEPPESAAGAAPSHSALDFAADIPVGNARVELPFTFPADYRFTIELYATARSLAVEKTNRGIILANEFQLKHTSKGLELAHVLADKSVDRLLYAEFEPGRRVNLTAVADGAEMRLFVDGVLAGATPLRLETEQKSTITLGSLHVDHPNWFPFDGTIDELRISRIPRYSENFIPPASYEADQDTIALYQFEEGSGDVLKDASANGQHGSIIGARWVRID